MIAMGLLSFPYQLSAVGYSQWWLPIFFGIIANVTIIPMIWLAGKYKEDSLFKIHEILFGRIMGKTINMVLIIIGCILMAATVERYLEMIQLVAFPYRTLTGPLIMLMLVAVFIAKRGIKSVARFCIIAFFLTSPMVYLLRWGLEEGKITHLLPLFNFTGKEFLAATKEGYSSIVGYELLMFYFPYIINQKKVFKHASIGIWISIFFYFLISMVSVIHFSEWQLKNVLYPVLNLFKYVELSFLEKIDTIGITFWVFLILSTVSAYLWVLKEGIESLRSKKHAAHLYIIAVIITVMVFIPLSQSQEEKIYGHAFYASYALILWPNLLSLVHMIKSRKGRGSNDKSKMVYICCLFNRLFRLYVGKR